MARELVKKGTDLIIEYEKEILKVYDDGFGYPTLGIGHLLTAAEKKAMPLGTKITREQSRAYFKTDAKKYVDAVNAAVKVPVTQNQFDALVSLAFNIGTGGIAKASLMKKLNRRDYAGAADGFLAWNKVKGVAVRGLTRRRNQERSLFLTPDSPNSGSSTTTAVPSADNDTPLDTTAVDTLTPTIQNADNITNVNPPTIAPTVETAPQDVPAPAPMGSVEGATKVTVLGFAVPTFLVATWKTVTELIDKGFVRAEDIGQSVLNLITNNGKYILIGIGLVILVIIVKKVERAVIFIVTIITHAVPSLNSITVVAPETVTPKKPWWKFW